MKQGCPSRQDDRAHGLLFELCPGAVPAGVMQVIRSWQHGGHHAHHGDHGGHDSKHCPIGHLLSAAVAVDTTWASGELPATPFLAALPVIVRLSSPGTSYSSRDPPSL